MNRKIFKYFFKFLNFWMLVCLFAFFVVGLIIAFTIDGEKSVVNTLLTYLCIFLCPIIFVLLLDFRFLIRIKKIVDISKIKFDDKNVEKISMFVYISDDWLIECGNFAVLKKDIKQFFCYEKTLGYFYQKINLLKMKSLYY